MLKENIKLLELNTLAINRLEKEREECKQDITKEKTEVELYQLVLERQKEKKQNKKCLVGATSGLILFIISKIFYQQVLLNPNFAIPSLVSEYAPLVLSAVICLGEYACCCFSSGECKYSLDNLIASGIVTKEEVEELLNKNTIYLSFMTHMIEEQIGINEEKVSKLEEDMQKILNYNDRIKKANKLEEKVLNDKLIKRELESEFEEFLDEYTNPMDIHFNNKIEHHLKLTFTNK